MAYDSTTNQLFSAGSAAISRASQSASNISRPGVSVNLASLSYTQKDLKLGTPPKFTDVFTDLQSAQSISAQLDSQVDAILQKYFPAINGEFKSLDEDWCIEVIKGTKPFGTDSTVFELVWQQARDRAYRTQTSEQAQLEASCSSRGFSLPTGALVNLISQAAQRTTDAINDVSRDQAVKDADIKVDILKQATNIAAQLKLGIMSTAADYFRSYFAVQGFGNDTARIRAQAYQTFYSALADYYGVELSQEQLRLRAAESKAGIQNDGNRIRVGLYSGDTASPAHAQAARAFADAAGAAYQAAGTLSAEIRAV
jgi:hypothetical protein